MGGSGKGKAGSELELVAGKIYSLSFLASDDNDQDPYALLPFLRGMDIKKGQFSEVIRQLLREVIVLRGQAAHFETKLAVAESAGQSAKADFAKAIIEQLRPLIQAQPPQRDPQLATDIARQVLAQMKEQGLVLAGGSSGDGGDGGQAAEGEKVGVAVDKLMKDLGIDLA